MIRECDPHCTGCSGRRHSRWKRSHPRKTCSIAATSAGRSPGARCDDARHNRLELQAFLIERKIDTPIVFLTGSQSVPMAVTAMRRGAVDFLEKPFENDDLVKRVRQALRHVPTHGDRALHAEYDRRSALLTPREREVMDHVVAGKTSKEIGRALGVSPRTVEIHRMRVMDKMQAGSLAELVRMALTRERQAGRC